MCWPRRLVLPSIKSDIISFIVVIMIIISIIIIVNLFSLIFSSSQVRDWFKDRRTEEEAPKIVEEKKSELFLSNGNTNVNIKQEPFLELEEEALSNTNATNTIGNANDQAAEVVKVKQEPLEEEEEEEGPVSAVLRSKVILIFIV